MPAMLPKPDAAAETTAPGRPDPSVGSPRVLRIPHGASPATPKKHRVTFRRRALGLRVRVTLGFALIVAAVTAALAIVSYQRISSDVVNERDAVALRQSYTDARTVRARLRGASPDAGAVIASLESRQGTPILRFGGEWFAASVGAGRSDIPSSLLQVVAAGRSGHQRTTVGGSLFDVVGVPIPAINAEYFEFIPLSDVQETLRSVRRSLALGAAIAAVLGGLLGALASHTVLRPLRRVANAAATVQGGDLTTHVDSTGDPDLDPLLGSFNEMVDELRKRIDRDARFAGDVTHELRGPLAAMSAATAHARRHADNPDKIRYSLDVLDQNVERFSELVVDLLEMSRMEAGVAELNLEAVRVRDFLDAVVVAFATPVPVQISGDVPVSVILDKRRIGQCLMNLLQNAERYGGGATAIVAGTAGGSLQLAVEDDGPGVPEHEREYIFERFARGTAARDIGGGTGLGLALVADHLHLHGGSVAVVSSPSGGSRFELTLPLEVPHGATAGDSG